MIDMNDEPNWTAFYQALGINGPKLLRNIDPLLTGWIEFEAKETDAFYSAELNGVLESNWDEPERAISETLIVWKENIKTRFLELVGTDSFHPWASIDRDEKRRLERSLERVSIDTNADEFFNLAAAARYGMSTDSTGVELVLQGILQYVGSTSEGALVRAVATPWKLIVSQLSRNWNSAFEISDRKWEELVAAAFEQDGYDEVVLTPRSGDYGRDVIAIKRGVGTVRIIGSVKAYAPGHPVRHDDVRALIGVPQTDLQASKGMIMTTSRFAPNIYTDPYISPLIPYRLELMDGAALRRWLIKIARK